MSRTVYAVPGVTPQGQELSSKEEALRLAEAHGSAVFAYRKEDDGSLRLLGTKTRKGKVIEYKNNPLKDFSMPAYAFDRELRRMGQTGHSVHRDLRTGLETKKPKTVYFAEPDAALQALAVFLVLEGVDTRGAVDMTTDRAHRKMAAIRLPNGDIYAATLSPEGNDYWIQTPHDGRMLRWGTWALAGQYPTTKTGRKPNPRRPQTLVAEYRMSAQDLRETLKAKPSKRRAQLALLHYVEALCAAMAIDEIGSEVMLPAQHTLTIRDPDVRFVNSVGEDIARAFDAASRTGQKQNPNRSMAQMKPAQSMQQFRNSVKTIRQWYPKPPSQERAEMIVRMYTKALIGLSVAGVDFMSMTEEESERDPDYYYLSEVHDALARAFELSEDADLRRTGVANTVPGLTRGPGQRPGASAKRKA